MPMCNDDMDRFRKESNARFMDEAIGAGNFRHLRYLTVSVRKGNIADARAYFNRVGSELAVYLSRLGSKCEELDAMERLALIHNFFRPDEESDFYFDINDVAKKGHSFRDYICPIRLK